MKLTSRKRVASSDLRRDQRQVDRNRAPPMRSVFPQVEQLRIELNFKDRDAMPPSPQAFTLFPAAPAFFRFACPCAQCDGEFDLTAAVSGLVAEDSRPGRTAAARLSCQGVRARERADSHPCPIEVKYALMMSS
jgi:hypothetical protein